ncbi:UspA domain protein [Haloterrigena turkmenica DSM 5511]|uniref:UspA domain protein n=1 Tax=Haloterrigena turkmenica (strain ATCC 51198 / DSM 5511 / JCM 9101 / NCIMB 13204 / VKM B-1734 / 4k) TaxID=543526 RepID=D2RWK5_HALTV|nr:universal stress protein [Haloterrigena turkmenica]ADB61506.1 UspA domain protein [Haloterrigena turkmenica DSM 5511]
MANTPTERPILVAVANPDHTPQLVRTAGDLARASDSAVRIVSVVVKSRDSPFAVYSDEAIIERYSGNSQEIVDRAVDVAPDDVAVSGTLVVSRSVSDGILSAVEQTEPRALVVGWEDRTHRADTVIGTTIDRLIERAPCDLYVERIGHEAGAVDSILVPVAGGPHVGPAVGVAKAIAARNDATVVLRSVVDPDTDEAAAREFLEDAAASLEAAPGPSVRTESLLDEGDDVAERLLEVAPDHDVLVFGATREGAIHRRLVGSIPQTVTRRTDRTVILARDGETIGGPVRRRIRRFLPTA